MIRNNALKVKIVKTKKNKVIVEQFLGVEYTN